MGLHDVHIHDHDLESPLHVIQTKVIQETVTRIRECGFQRIALQLPDKLIPHSHNLYTAWTQALSRTEENHPTSRFFLFILGDTSYGNCCVDEVAAEHLQADCIVHYGHACASRPSVLPVFYILDRGSSFDDTSFLEQVAESLVRYVETIEHHEDLLLLSHPQYSHVLPDLLSLVQRTLFTTTSSDIRVHVQAFASEYFPAVEGHLQTSTPSIHPNPNPKDHALVLYLGPHDNSAHFQTLLLTYGSMNREVHCLDGSSSSSSEYQGSELSWTPVSPVKALMRRYHAIAQVESVEIIGILVGTLAVSRYQDMILGLTSLISRVGKKAYVFVVGKINVPKLANYAEIDAFVLVACPEHSLLDSREFYKPIVTPIELFQALTQQEKDREEEPMMRYHLGFKEVLAQIRAYLDDHPIELEHNTGSTSQAMIDTTPASSAAVVLSQRQYRGLEVRVGETPAHVAIDGKYGTAKGYTEITHREL